MLVRNPDEHTFCARLVLFRTSKRLVLDWVHTRLGRQRMYIQASVGVGKLLQFVS